MINKVCAFFHFKSKLNLAFFLSLFLGFWLPSTGYSQVNSESLKVATFDMDVTPPLGTNYLTYDPQVGTWDLGLRAKGIVIQGAGQPIVLCAIDWIGIGNEGMDAFKGTLAQAAGTIPERVSVNVVHQHDAPRCDFGAEQRLLKAGANPSNHHPVNFDGNFAREVLRGLRKVVEESLNHAQSINHIGFGEAEVFKVASNRNIYDKDGMVRATRFTATADPKLRAEPEGVIDPLVSVVSFWNDDKPVAVLSYYATHPQSYYRTGIPNPDFPGIARFMRQIAVPQALHIHFNGAGGNIGAGKYNDGSPENRMILAERLADGMKRAWEATEKRPISQNQVNWEVEKVSLPVGKHLYKIKEDIMNNDSLLIQNHALARKMAFLDRMENGVMIDIGMLKVNDVRILFMPGELFVEYQLAAKAERPDLKVAMAAYGDFGPGYIGTTILYDKGGYEVSERATNVDPSVEGVLMGVIKKLLRE
ncbi:MAG: hypothetical protein PHI32_15120 [Dysgonamonadaceae bacterium]|nr:hypothetical protein [Dysgonamonadaceae bacterium]